jgi:hypothetical protein
MAKKHDEEQKKKNGGGHEVARKFMNYIEYGNPLQYPTNKISRK